MTIDECIDILDDNFTVLNTHGHYTESEESEAIEMAIASLEAWDEVKQEINDLFSKSPCYMPNYDAYKMFLEIINKHLQKVGDSQ